MTNQEFSNEFDVLYNNITSNQAPGLDEYEKSVFLTKAQDEIIKSYFNPRLNKTQEGFDGNEKRQIDFSMIMGSIIYEPYNQELLVMEEVVKKFTNMGYTPNVADLQNKVPNPGLDELPEKIISISQLKPFIYDTHINGVHFYIIRESVYDALIKGPIKITPSKKQAQGPGSSTFDIDSFKIEYHFSPGIFDNRFNTKSITIADDIMMIVNEYVEVEREDKTSRLTVLPINYSEYSRLMSKPYKRPLKNQAWRILDNSTKHKIAEIVIGPNDTLDRYAIRYIRRPQAIILCNLEGVTLDDKSEEQPCELDPILHPEILQRAVELAKATYAGDLTSQIALGQSSQTNMGIIAQSSK